MEKEQIIESTKKFVQERLKGEGSGHDWWHIYRVWKAALSIGKKENVDLFVVQLAALLHDIADWKFHGGDENAGPKVARQYLYSCGIEDEIIISKVCTIIQEISFKGAQVSAMPTTKEGKVVQDADKLDAIGAIGIARCFMFSGHAGKIIYDPALQPTLHSSFEEYQKAAGPHNPAVNHFYEKLLLLKDRMNTETAHKIAQERHRFMELYLDRFFAEWEGKK